ncbi:SIMPL domain-containing protein [Streptomyces sp. 21So2-11]|uniref:SIMPL domain-containing protein n=1 Tax=Streptomyces sp. 21So2-11 TaxID=3144408 RepID=UPI00321B04E5
MPVRTSSAPTAPPAGSNVIRSFAAAVLAGGLLATGAAPATAAAAAPLSAPAPAAATVTVAGEGSAAATPDLAVVTAGVEVTKPTAKAAMAGQSAAAQKLLDAVRKQGVADRDVQTTGISLNPVHRYEDGASKLTGYQAGQTFTVKVRDINKTGALLKAVTDATGDDGRINGVVFDVSDPAALRAAAREAAYGDARNKAEQYARLSGRELGRLVSLTEGAGGQHSPLAMQPGALADAKVPVAPGEIQEQVTVTVVYELD